MSYSPLQISPDKLRPYIDDGGNVQTPIHILVRVDFESARACARALGPLNQEIRCSYSWMDSKRILSGRAVAALKVGEGVTIFFVPNKPDPRDRMWFEEWSVLALHVPAFDNGSCGLMWPNPSA